LHSPPFSAFAFWYPVKPLSHQTGWPRSLEIRENRENGQNKFPAGKNQGISKFKKKSGNYQGILQNMKKCVYW